MSLNNIILRYEREFAEAAILCSALFFEDSRADGYLSDKNLKCSFFGINSFVLYKAFKNPEGLFHHKIKGCITEQYLEAIKFFNIICSSAEQDKGGLNTPKYCLWILQEDFKAYFLKTLTDLIATETHYNVFVTEVWMDVNDKKVFFLEDAYTVLAYFKKIDYSDGFFKIEHVIDVFLARIKLIKQDLEKQFVFKKLRSMAQFNEPILTKIKIIENEL